MELQHEQILERLTWLTDKGGPVIVVIAILSVLTLTLFIAKLMHFWRLGMFGLNRADSAITAWERNETLKARDAVSAMTGCVPGTVLAAMSGALRHGEDRALIEAETTRVARGFLNAAHGGFRLFELIITAAPLLGLLGTVLGMIEAFRRIEDDSSRVDPGVLAGGIWEALLTTAAGMIVALIALAALNILEAIVERARHALEDNATRVLNGPASLMAAA
ncbi:MAG: MotA/TolQ/ExbB proton channel family protein [Methyloligellaceae bacterium]